MELLMLALVLTLLLSVFDIIVARWGVDSRPTIKSQYEQPESRCWI